MFLNLNSFPIRSFSSRMRPRSRGLNVSNHVFTPGYGQGVEDLTGGSRWVGARSEHRRYPPPPSPHLPADTYLYFFLNFGIYLFLSIQLMFLEDTLKSCRAEKSRRIDSTATLVHGLFVRGYLVRNSLCSRVELINKPVRSQRRGRG